MARKFACFKNIKTVKREVQTCFLPNKQHVNERKINSTTNLYLKKNNVYYHTLDMSNWLTLNSFKRYIYLTY